jgi:hypothetical protein
LRIRQVVASACTGFFGNPAIIRGVLLSSKESTVVNSEGRLEEAPEAGLAAAGKSSLDNQVFNPNISGNNFPCQPKKIRELCES